MSLFKVQVTNISQKIQCHCSNKCISVEIGNFIQKLGKVQERTKFLFMAHKEWFIAYDGCSEAGGGGVGGPGEGQGCQVCNHLEF